MPAKTRIRCYLDGRNFYYGVAKPYQCKWIDLEKLVRTVLQESVCKDGVAIEKILMFSSSVSGNAAARQGTYFLALKEHSPSVEIVLGHHLERVKKGLPVTTDDRGRIISRGEEEVKIAVYEEKRTDVNLATRMVDDAHVWANLAPEDRAFDAACLISNDADLAAALQIKKRLGQRTILLAPRRERAWSSVAADLKRFTAKRDRVLEIGRVHVEGSLLPAKVGEHSPPDAPGWWAS